MHLYGNNKLGVVCFDHSTIDVYFNNGDFLKIRQYEVGKNMTKSF